MFLYSHWLALPLPTRVAIATKFGIAKTGATHVADNRIISDGYNIGDVERALNIDAIQQYLGIENTDMETLFKLLVAKIEGKEVVTPDTPVIPEAPVLLVPEELLEAAKEITSTLVPPSKPKRKRITRKPKK